VLSLRRRLFLDGFAEGAEIDDRGDDGDVYASFLRGVGEKVEKWGIDGLED
jgi:hypothetical protein